MFETVELDRKLSKEEYENHVREIRQTLLELQVEIRALKVPVIVVFGGVDGAGKGESANLLSEWMDPRWVKTHAYDAPTEDEAQRPEFWRYWRDLPGAGQVGVFLSAWYSEPLIENAYGGDSAVFDQRLEQIVEFERMLAENGAVVIKFWMHLSKAKLKKRLEGLESDPLQAWRVGEREWTNFAAYDAFLDSAEHLIIRTSTGRSPWHLVEGSDSRYRAIKVANLLIDAISRRLEEKGREKQILDENAEHLTASGEGSSAVIGSSALQVPGPHSVTILSRMDMSLALRQDEYKKRLKAAQARLGALHQKALQQQRSVVCVFEGMDAAGKGGAIRRITSSLLSKYVTVIPIAAPTDEEFAHHYLWRFWRQLPRDGRITIFDRSWYGRVLVERVEGFAHRHEWRRAYNEINHFEKQLVGSGIVMAKFWLQISQDEQLQRFEDRANIPYKAWKLTDEDWRNREKWPVYANAVHDMVERTSTRYAPWYLIEGEDKRWARVKVLETLCEQLGAVLDPAPPKKKKKSKKKG